MILGGGQLEAQENAQSAELEDVEQQMSAAFAGLGQVMSQAFSGTTTGQVVQPINFRDLKGLLAPQLGELQLVSSSGETQAAIGINMSTADGTYKDAQGREYSITITDLGTMKGLGGMAAGALGAYELDREWDTGYERVYIDGTHRIQEKYDSADESGELQIFTEDGRFSVVFLGPSMEVMQRARQAMDLAQLERWKNVGVSQ